MVSAFSMIVPQTFLLHTTTCGALNRAFRVGIRATCGQLCQMKYQDPKPSTQNRCANMDESAWSAKPIIHHLHLEIILNQEPAILVRNEALMKPAMIGS